MVNEISHRCRPHVERAITGLAIILIAVSVYFRFWHLGNIPGVSGDEAINGVDALDLLHGHSIAWVTPTGHLYPIFYLGPVLLLHAMFPPSVILLRIVAALCGVLAVGANYLLCRKYLGPRTALISTLLLATLPANIEQSRSGWDPCESLLVDLFVVYGALHLARIKNISIGRHITNVIVCLIAILVHPSNIFAVALMPAAALVRWWPVSRKDTSKLGEKIAFWSIVILLVLIVGSLPYLLAHQPHMISWIRSRSNRGLVLGYANFFSGRNAYTFTTGSYEPTRGMDWVDAVSIAPWVICLVCVGVILCRKASVDIESRVIAGGWAIQLLLFEMGFGSGALLPPIDRYALCLIVPALLMFTRSLELACSTYTRKDWLSQALVLVMSSILLFGFYRGYFVAILQPRGNPECGFRTNVTDPKKLAIDYIASQARPNDVTYVLASSWWTYYPAKYFASMSRQLHVVNLKDATRADHASCLSAIRSGKLWTIEFIDERGIVPRTLSVRGIHWTFIAVPDYGGRPSVIVGHPVLSRGDE